MTMLHAIFCLALFGVPIQDKPAETKRPIQYTYAEQLPNGQLVVSCRPASDCPPIAASAQLVDPKTGKVLAMFAGKDAGMGLAKVDPTGKHIAFHSDGDLHIWPLEAGLNGADEAVRKRRSESEVTLHLAPRDEWGAARFQWTHDGQYLVTWAQQFFQKSPTGKVQLWTCTGELLWTGPMVAEADVHPTLNQICAVRESEVLLGWPLDAENKPNADGMRAIPIKGAWDTIQFSPNGELLAVGGTGKLGKGEGPGYGGDHNFPWLWLLHSESGHIHLSKGIFGIDRYFEAKIYLSHVSWSPDGTMIGVSLGKGHAVGAISSKDGSVVWTGNGQGGRMHEVFNTAWTDTGILNTGWGSSRLVDPRNPGNPVRIERVARARMLNLADTDDIILLYGWHMARMNPRTGKMRWTL